MDIDSNKYINLIHRCNKPVPCLVCHIDVLVRQYESHITIKHKIDIVKYCEWCGEEGVNYTHRYNCVKQMVRSNQKKNKSAFLEQLYHEKQRLDERRMIDILPWDVDFVLTDYEFNNRELDNWLKNKSSQDSGGDDIVTIEGQHQFYDKRLNIHENFIINWDNTVYCYRHLIIEHSTWPTFKSFLNIVQPMSYNVYPYWCCKADNRHIIVRYPRLEKDKIESLWIDMIDSTSKLLETRQHFISSLVKVSSKCGNKPLPPYAAFFMSLLYNNGIEEYFTAKYARKTIDYCYAKRDENNKWTVPYGYLNSLRDLVLPIDRNLMLDRHDLTITTLLDAGDTMSIREWNHLQLTSGNRFINRLADTTHILTNRQQQILDAVHKMAVKKDLSIFKMQKEINYLSAS